MTTVIRYHIYSAELPAFAAEGESCKAFAERYALSLAGQLQEGWPDAEVEVEVVHNTTGAGSGYQGIGEDAPQDWEVAEIANAELALVTA